jgi:UDP-N-acetylmuramoyl-tripeptide--D-alanyl-D-alanine ligase
MVWVLLRSVRILHLLQLDSYSNTRLMKWLWALPLDRLFEYRTGLLLLALLIGHLVLWQLGLAHEAELVLFILGAASTLFFFLRKPVEEKKPLVYTGRAKRILISALLISTLVVGFAGFYAYKLFTRDGTGGQTLATLMILIAGLFVIQGTWLIIMFSNILLIPVQKSINASYVRAAKRRITEISPIVVGISGSYGKTSTKFILDTILSERYKVFKTPESYNNILGISRAINSSLEPHHEVFIVELGGYKRGDLFESTDLVHPQYGILTAIGPEHFERLKTMENVEAMNYELVESLPETGTAIFNNDMERCRKLADKTKRVKVIRYGLDRSQPGLRLTADKIQVSSDGLSFTIVDDEGHVLQTSTKLLGRHNILNILGAACVALEMGMSLAEIGRAMPKIKQVPHRLQLMPGAGGVVVIDDAYNSNPVGALEALNVLREFNSGKRVLVTPGMVELGELEAMENEEFGAHAAKVCDYVLLVGARQTQAILKGLQRERFPQDRLRVVRDLDEATQELQKIVRSGDVVLFENDLPDLYAEA